ncbi:MAG: c-type cytochrome, partial [Phycisphaerales bacterium]|nr:c-type cytochrome [Phycisphaerales bacterium]
TIDGGHQFAITSDDHSALYIWPEGRPDERKQIAFLDQWTPLDDWESRPGQVSSPIQMKAGEAWIVEARHSEGGGGDHLAIGWKEPGRPWNRPIGVTRPDRTHASLVRRALSASLRDGDPARIQAVADVALDSGQGDVLRREAMEVIRQWPAPELRERVQGRYRPVEGERDVAGWKAVMERVLPALAESDQVVAMPARAIAEEHGIALDPDMLFETLEDQSIDVAQRISTLRLLTRREESRQRAIELAMGGLPALRAEGLLAMSLHEPERALPLAKEAIESNDLVWRRAGIESLAIIDQPEAESLLLERLNALDSEHPAVALDVLEAARRRGGLRLESGIRKWSQAPEGERSPAYAMTREGGDVTRGRDLVFYHAGASCLRCHVIDGTGGAAGPDLSSVGNRLDTESLVRSLLEPQAEVAEGYGDASAMPAMTTYLTPMQIRDVVAYLKTLQAESN